MEKPVLVRPQEKKYSSHAKWGPYRITVLPTIARHADQPDEWRVTGVHREYAHKEHAEKVAEFLRKHPPDHIKDALRMGEPVDSYLPAELQNLPRWNDVHGVDAKKESYTGCRAVLEQIRQYLEAE